MEKQAEIKIYGRVQKAGYRDFIDETAFNLNINGYVENLRDGTVHVVCEGHKDKIKEFMDKINIRQYPISVEKIDVKYANPTGKFKTFEIIRNEDLTTATYERMDDDFKSHFDERLTRMEFELAEIKAKIATSGSY